MVHGGDGDGHEDQGPVDPGTEEPGDAAEEIRRLRALVRNIVAAVVIVLILGAMVWSLRDMERDSKRNADEMGECLRLGIEPVDECVNQ